jgi:hypothetical protein
LVLVDDAGNERTTLPPADRRGGRVDEGSQSAELVPRGERNGYLERVVPAGEAARARRSEREADADEVAWATVVEAALLLGTAEPREKIPPDELYKRLEPFKRRVAEDIRGETTEGPAGVDLGVAVSCDQQASSPSRIHAPSGRRRA